MCWTDNPIADFEWYDRQQAKQLERLPVCSSCDEPIQSEHCYEINGELICPECLETYHRKYTDDFID